MEHGVYPIIIDIMTCAACERAFRSEEETCDFCTPFRPGTDERQCERGSETKWGPNTPVPKTSNHCQKEHLGPAICECLILDYNNNEWMAGLMVCEECEDKPFCTRCHYIQTPWILWTPQDVEHRLAVEQRNLDDDRAVLEALIVTEDLDTLGAGDHLSPDHGTKSKPPHVPVILWSATVAILYVLQGRITTLGKRYRCRCQCGCTRRPGKLVQCCGCGARI